MTKILVEATLFPNPSTGTVYLTESGSIQCLTVTDVTGPTRFLPGKIYRLIKLTLSHLPKGVYKLT